MVSLMFMRVNARCAHQVRPPGAPTTGPWIGWSLAPAVSVHTSMNMPLEPDRMCTVHGHDHQQQLDGAGVDHGPERISRPRREGVG
jgi:hypothetical protein